jgi:prepilin peptidase CpaA
MVFFELLSRLSPFVIGAGVALLLAASLEDVATRLISNKIPLALACCGVLARSSDGTLEAALLMACGLFFLALLGWRAGALGGGDVKTLAAASLLVPPVKVPYLLFAVVLAGGGVALLYLVLSRTLPPPSPLSAVSRRSLPRRILRIENWRLHRRPSLPYATAITIGTIFTLFR